MGVWRLRASSPPLKRPGPPRPARRPPVLSPAASAASPSPTREPQAAGAGAGEGVRRGEESWARGSSCQPGFEFGLTFPSLSTPAVCPEATRTPSGWTARLGGGADALRKGVGLSRPPRPPLQACRAARQRLPPAPPHPPRPPVCHAQHPHAWSCPLPGPGPSPSNAVRVAPVMSLAATSRTPWASPRPVQHHHTGDKVDHLPRTQHKQIRAGVTTPVPVTGVGIAVKERVRPRAG